MVETMSIQNADLPRTTQYRTDKQLHIASTRQATVKIATTQSSKESEFILCDNISLNTINSDMEADLRVPFLCIKPSLRHSPYTISILNAARWTEQ